MEWLVYPQAAYLPKTATYTDHHTSFLTHALNSSPHIPTPTTHLPIPFHCGKVHQEVHNVVGIDGGEGGGGRGQEDGPQHRDKHVTD